MTLWMKSWAIVQQHARQELLTRLRTQLIRWEILSPNQMESKRTVMERRAVREMLVVVQLRWKILIPTAVHQNQQQTAN